MHFNANMSRNKDNRKRAGKRENTKSLEARELPPLRVFGHSKTELSHVTKPQRKTTKKKKKIFFSFSLFLYFLRVSRQTATFGICVKLEETYDFIINKKPNLVQVGTKGTASPSPNEMPNLERDALQST